MKLGTKLFLFVGILLLFVCVTVYFVPIYVAYEQGKVDSLAYQARIDKQREADWKNTYNWLVGEMSTIEGVIEAFLVLAAENPGVIPFPKDRHDAWLPALQLLRYSAHLNLVQLATKDWSAAITLDNVDFYWAYEDPINEKISWVTFSTRRWDDPITWAKEFGEPGIIQHTFIGKRQEGTNVFVLYNLVDLYREENAYLRSKFKSEKEVLQYMQDENEKIRKIETENPLERGIIGAKTGVEGEEPQKVARRRLLVRFVELTMRERLLEIAEGLALYGKTSPIDEGAPAAGALIDPKTHQGGGAFANDLFSTNRLFDVEELFKNFPPTEEGLPMSSGFGLVPSEVAGYETVVNSLLFPEGSLTVGTPFVRIMRDLPVITGDFSVLMVDGKVNNWTGYTEEDVMPQDEFLAAVAKASFPDKTGFVTIGKERYYYSRYKPREEWDLEFLTFGLAEEIEAPLQIFQERSKALMRTVALASLAISVGIFLIALGVLLVIARRFTRPIQRLADATEHVAQEKYEEIKLPDVSRSQGEVYVLTHAFQGMVHGLHDRAKIRDALNKVVSKEIAEEILQGEIQLGGEVKNVCVLFAKVCNFRQVTEGYAPEKTVGLLNDHLDRMTKIIESHNGVIDKYMSDEVMALFGAPIALKEGSLQAIKAALEMQNQAPMPLGIGLNCGEMVAGNMGAEDRLNYTVLGANVNLAARLSQEAGPGEILVSEAMTKIPELAKVKFEARSTIRLKGFSEPINIYRVVSHA